MKAKAFGLRFYESKYGYLITMSESDLFLTEKDFAGAKLLNPVKDFNSMMLK